MCAVLLPPGGYPTSTNKYIDIHVLLTAELEDVHRASNRFSSDMDDGGKKEAWN
jgi:hypothetical protein